MDEPVVAADLHHPKPERVTSSIEGQLVDVAGYFRRKLDARPAGEAIRGTSEGKVWRP